MLPLLKYFHLKALYEEAGDAEVTAPPEAPGELKEDPKEENTSELVELNLKQFPL